MEDTVTRGVPAGASPIIPRLVCRDPAAEIHFLTEVFHARIGVERPDAQGRTAHAMMLFGSAMLMVESEWPEVPSRAPAADGTSPVVMYIYVEDVDATLVRAVERGAVLLAPAKTQFWGDRTGWIIDPSGHVWTIASRAEETTEGQRRERWAAELKDGNSRSEPRA
jgi:PhnB protein